MAQWRLKITCDNADEYDAALAYLTAHPDATVVEYDVTLRYVTADYNGEWYPPGYTPPT